MTSEYDHDEIKDSEFPVDFSNDPDSLDIYGVWVKSGPREVDAVQSFLADDISAEEASLPEMTDFEDEISSLPDINDISDLPSETELNLGNAYQDSEIQEQEIPTDTDNTEEIENLYESNASDDISENDFSLESITIDEVSFESESTETETVSEPDISIIDESQNSVEQPSPSEETLPSDDDFSSFLDDINSSSSSSISQDSVDTSDLDSFIDSFNEIGGLDSKETEKLFDDTAPVELDLDFDEDFIADSDMIKASGSNISESEYMNSEFGVEMIDETKQGSDDFDDVFSSIEDITVGEIDKMSSTDSKYESSIIETSEFDDLLQSFESVPAPIKKTASEPVTPQRAEKTFSLSVTEEDNFDGVNAPVTDESDEEMEVPLFIDDSLNSGDKQAIGESNASTPVFVETNDSSLSDMDFDLDIPIEITDFKTDDRNLAIKEESEYTEEENNDAVPEIDESAGVVESLEDSVSLDFDDISAVENELSDFAPETGDIGMATNDKSTELLMHIAEELAGIKNELSVLKSELAHFKAIPTATDSGSESTDAAATSDASGFFADDDPDEAIALTGDELNNILITADFTEEKSEEITDEKADTVPDEAEISLSIDESPVAEADIPVEADYTEHEIPETLPDSVFEIPNLDADTEITVGPVTKVDEDMSYLEESDTSIPDMNDVAIDEPDLEIIDFDDEKLEEPELDEFNIDLSEIEQDYPAEQMVPKEENFEESIMETPVIEQEDVSIPESPVSEPQKQTGVTTLPVDLKDEIKSVLTYMDQLLESLPEDKIEEFARSEHFEVYKKLFEELGIS